MIRIEEITEKMFNDPDWKNVNEMFSFFEGDLISSPFPIQQGLEIQPYRHKINDTLEEISAVFVNRFGAINKERASIAKEIAVEWNKSLIDLQRKRQISSGTFEKYSALLDRLFAYLDSIGASVGENDKKELPTFGEYLIPKFREAEAEIIGILKDFPRDAKGNPTGKPLIYDTGEYKKQQGFGSAFKLFWRVLNDNNILIQATGLTREDHCKILSGKINGLPLTAFSNEITVKVEAIYGEYFKKEVKKLIF